MENDSHYFSLYHEKPSISMFCVFTQNIATHISRQLACPLPRYCFL